MICWLNFSNPQDDNFQLGYNIQPFLHLITHSYNLSVKHKVQFVTFSVNVTTNYLPHHTCGVFAMICWLYFGNPQGDNFQLVVDVLFGFLLHVLFNFVVNKWHSRLNKSCRILRSWNLSYLHNYSHLKYILSILLCNWSAKAYIFWSFLISHMFPEYSFK